MDERPRTSPIQPRTTRGWASALRRRFVRSEFAYEVLSTTVAAYLRTVWATNRLTVEPTSSETVFERHAPLIAVTWHREAFLLPLLRPRAYPVDVIVSRAGDGEIISRTLHKLGSGTVRGSGATDPSRMFDKGSVAAFRGLKAALDGGHSVVMTADFDARTHGTVSPGVIALARLSQRPIIPAVVTTSNRVHLGSWDRTALNLPFGRAAFVHADPILVPRRATQDELEEKRLEVERALTAITDRAYAITDKRRG
jgi:lysophospholipid acyltransferase (LPLAT)-like uncharacterized protein